MFLYVLGGHAFELDMDSILGNSFPFPFDASHCVLLASPETSVKLNNREHQMYRANLSNVQSMKVGKELLKKEAACVISFPNYEDFHAVQDATRAIDNHVTAYVSNQAPTENMLKLINRPLLWINKANNVLIMF